MMESQADRGGASLTEPARAAYGAWLSPLSAADVALAAIRLSQTMYGPDGKTLYWLEGRPQEGGRQVLVRLDEHRISGGQSRPDFVADQIERKVERANRRNDPTGNTQREAEFSLRPRCGIQRDHFTDDATGFFCRNFNDFACATGFQNSLSQNLSLFLTDQSCQFRFSFGHQGGNTTQQLRSLITRQLPHDLGAVDQSGQRTIDIA